MSAFELMTVSPSVLHAGETVKIAYSGDEEVTGLEIYSIEGKCVMQFDGTEVTWDAAGLSNGIYIVSAGYDLRSMIALVRYFIFL